MVDPAVRKQILSVAIAEANFSLPGAQTGMTGRVGDWFREEGS
jgi:hypothetical protein